MEFGFKLTTHGRAVLAACGTLEAPLRLTRVAFGSGRVGEDTDLSDVHELLCYEDEGTIGKRSHEDDRLYLEVQYTNDDRHAGTGGFLLSEFMLYAADPVTGEEGDLAYASLGDYCQSVPGYREGFPASTWTFPITIVVSGEVEVSITTAPGLVTYDDLQAMAQAGMLGIRRRELTIPTEGWEAEEVYGYGWMLELPQQGVTERMAPLLTVLPEGTQAAADCGLAHCLETRDGALRLWARKVPAQPIAASLVLLGDTGWLSGIGGGAPALPPAGAETLGGVMVREGSGLRVDAQGVLCVDAATEEEVAELLAQGSGGETVEGV